MHIHCLQGFADFYDKRKPVVQDEQLEAIKVYSKLVSFIEKCVFPPKLLEGPIFFSSNSDVEKVRSTYQKLIALHREFNHQDDIIRCYDIALQTFRGRGDDPAAVIAEASSSCSETWLNFATYLLGREKLPEDCWEKVRESQK